MSKILHLFVIIFDSGHEMVLQAESKWDAKRQALENLEGMVNVDPKDYPKIIAVDFFH